jgi:arginyl-tRNA synthetase
MKETIAELINRALAQLVDDGVLPALPDRPVQVENARDKAHGDFASNVAMVSSKAAGMKPRDLAEKIVAALPADDRIAEVSIAGPGFINFFVARDWLAGGVSKALADQRQGVPETPAPQTVVVDYSSPNLAKEMHVGHLRSTIIGDAVVRTLEFLGHRVIRQNHVGDWGTQFGMLLAHLEEEKEADSDTELAAELSDLEGFYRHAKKRFDEDAAFADRARALVVKLQSGDDYCLKLWREFNQISLDHCFQVYERLGVSIGRDDVRGESAYNDQLADIVAKLDQAGLLTQSDGALCVFMDEFKSKSGETLPVIVRKADGGYLYATTDLAALRYRQRELNADRILYFVDQRQALHFQQVFKLARLAGFIDDTTELAHMGFGTMNGPDGRPFKTRDGGTVKLSDLLDEARERALKLVQEKNPALQPDELDEIARVVGLGAVKYADLNKHRTSDYIFDFDQMLSFDGNTAPYLLYARTRVMSVFRKAGISPEQSGGDVVIEEEAEAELAAKLLQFPEVLERVADQGLPHLLCNYLFEVAGLFSSFYEKCPILASEARQRDSRLQIAALTAGVLERGMGLLGMETLERM